MAKWEYCSINGLRISFYEATGVRTERPKHDENFDDLAIAQLGDDGWEMVGVAVSRLTTLYFKRPKE